VTAREIQRGVTLAAVRRWPPTVNVEDAAQALGVSRATLYAALARGERPVQVVTVSRRLKVITASLLEVLEGSADRAVSA
jgi:predicted DNA-binding transcriptional regulator AlpA